LIKTIKNETKYGLKVLKPTYKFLYIQLASKLNLVE
jgi:hypothetical protein